jgi:hypothetical protein
MDDSDNKCAPLAQAEAVFDILTCIWRKDLQICLYIQTYAEILLFVALSCM